MAKSNDEFEQSRLGVKDAFGFWLSQHDVSFPALVQASVKAAFSERLDENSEAIVEAIAKASQ